MLARLSPFVKGEMLSVFIFVFFCLVRCPLFVFSGFSLLRVVVWKKFSVLETSLPLFFQSSIRLSPFCPKMLGKKSLLLRFGF